MDCTTTTGVLRKARESPKQPRTGFSASTGIDVPGGTGSIAKDHPVALPRRIFDKGGAFMDVGRRPGYQHSAQREEPEDQVLTREQAASSSVEVRTRGTVHRNWLFKRTPVYLPAGDGVKVRIPWGKERPIDDPGD